MLLFDGDDGTFHWGDQIMYKNDISEDDGGAVRLLIAPIFSKKNAARTFVVYCCMAGIREHEIRVRVEHLQNGSNAIVIEGEGSERAGADNTVYEHRVFRGTFTLPGDVVIDSRSEHFHQGLLIVSFHKEQV